MRKFPVGLSRDRAKAANSASISAKAGRNVSSRSPASVGATLRVVRASNQTPIRASSTRIAWLSPEGDMPSLDAALVKLASSETATNAAISFRSFRLTAALSSQVRAEFSDLSAVLQTLT